MAQLTKGTLDKVVQQFVDITGLPVVLKDIPGDYGLVLFAPGDGGEYVPHKEFSPSFATRDQLLLWMQGFVAGWREAKS